MPETEGSPVGTADLHGSTIAIETGKGEKTTFELVRLGTLKEFETVKDALVKAQDDLALAKASLDTSKGQRAQMSEQLAAANEAYKAEKEARADSEDERGRLNGLLESVRAARQAAIDANASLTSELDKAQVELQDACQELGHRVHVENALRQAEATLSTRAQELNAKDSELEDLMSAKSSLEETNTALEVAQKELCEARAEHADAHVVLTADLGTARQECDVSRAALSDLKAELLKHAGCMSDVLDAMHEKLTGE